MRWFAIRYTCLAVVWFLVTAATSHGVEAQSLDEVIRGLEAAYGRMTDLKAEFSQSSFNKSLNQTIPAQGVVSLKRGGKLRWEYSEPTKQEIVSDGKTLWVYTPTLNQVNVGPAPEALAGPAGSFLAGLGKVREHFTVRFSTRRSRATGRATSSSISPPSSRCLR